MWEFDENVAKTFAAHARQHIPNYENVIKKSVEICKLYGASAKIIDVGCAVGETLIRLHENGFVNLHGVDSSQVMLDKCPPNIATLSCSDQLPAGPYAVVLINWTLHFIRDKATYLQSIFDNLAPGGMVVISEKTSLDPLAINFYHDYKRARGVSEEEIKQKQASVADIMFINDVQYYLEVFKTLGFAKTHVIDSDWCFTTFACEKG
jgi:tRNA (cmo5U34)-methyltransferase